MAHYVFDISVGREPTKENPADIFEYCPFCECEIPVRIDPTDKQFHVICPVCGHYLLLCSYCPDTNSCDWSEETGCHMDRGGAKHAEQSRTETSGTPEAEAAK